MYTSDAAYSCDHCHRFSVVTWYAEYNPTD